jgi:hypothetical protein
MKLFMFVVFAAILMIGVNTASAQLPQPIHFLVNVTATPLEIGIDSDLEMADFAAGQTYTAIPDAAGSGVLTPNDGVASISSMGACNILGDINAQVLVSFVLPSRLYPTGGTGNGYVETLFNSTSAAWGASGAESNYFDPHNPTSMTLDAAGQAYIVIGGIFVVGNTVGPDAYEGEALVTAQYTGL